MNETPESKAAFRAARQIFREAAPEFIFATYFLPRAKRRAVDAIAAFCAMIADAMKLPEHSLAGSSAMREHPVVRTSIPLQQLPAENAASDSADACDGDTTDSRLGMLTARIDEIYDGTLELPATASRSPQQHAMLAMSIVAKDFSVDRNLFIYFAHGCRDSDTAKCAGSIGVMISSVLGVQHSDAHRHAIALATGIALAKNKSDRAANLLREGAEGICWLADDGSRFAAALVTVTAASRLRRPNASPIATVFLIPQALRLARRLDGETLPQF